MTNSKDKKQFGTKITPQIQRLIDQQPPNTKKEFEKWIQKIRDYPLLEQYQLLIKETSAKSGAKRTPIPF